MNFTEIGTMSKAIDSSSTALMHLGESNEMDPTELRIWQIFCPSI